MNAPLAVAFGWLLFGGSHLLLSRTSVRQRLVRRLGQRGFMALYTVVAALTISVLMFAAAQFGKTGPAGFNLAASPTARWMLLAIGFAGALLAFAGLLEYSRTAVAVLERRRRRKTTIDPQTVLHVSGVGRLSRHPFFVGFAALMIVHTMLATHLAGAMFFAGFALLCVTGIVVQDRKLMAQHPDAYTDYMKRTSVLPFGPREADDRELPPVWPVLLRSLAACLVLFALHRFMLIGYGAIFFGILTIAAGGGIAKQLLSSR